MRRLRQRHSLPVVEKLFETARGYVAEELLLKTPMPKTSKYLLDHEGSLRECFKYVPSRIDNNQADNALITLKLGAKNWLFVRHPDAGPRAAVMFTLGENCRQPKINPEAYFADVLARINDHPTRASMNSSRKTGALTFIRSTNNADHQSIHARSWIGV